MEHPTSDPPLCCSWSEKNSHAKIKLLAFICQMISSKTLKIGVGTPKNKTNMRISPADALNIDVSFMENCKQFPLSCLNFLVYIKKITTQLVSQ